MAEQAVEQLNNNYIAFPRAFYAKPKKDKNGKPIQCEIAFKPSSDARRYNAADILTLGAINKINVKYEGNVKLTYELLKRETGIRSNATVNNSLSKLEEDGKIKFCGTSKYEIVPEFSARSYVVIYNFLLTEKLDLGGKVSKCLSKNAAFLASEIGSFYLNEDNKGKYFDGGEQAVATLLNVAPGTAGGIINELVKVGAVYTKIKTVDSAGNVILKPGKGNSSAAKTVLVINTELLLRCKKIKAEIERRRKAKDNAANKPAQKKNYKKTSSDSKKKAPKKSKKQKAQKRSVTEEWAETLAKVNGLDYKSVVNSLSGDPHCIDITPLDDPPDNK